MNKNRSDNSAKVDSLIALLEKNFDDRPFSLQHSIPKKELNPTLRKLLKDRDTAKVAVARIIQAVAYQEKPFFLFSQYHLAKILNESENNRKYRAVRKLLQEHYLAIPITEKHSRKAQVWELKYDPIVNTLKEKNIDFEIKRQNILSYWTGNPINNSNRLQLCDKTQSVEDTSEEIEDQVLRKIQVLAKQNEFKSTGRIKDFELHKKEIEDLINGPNLLSSCKNIREKIGRVYRTDEVSFLKQMTISIFEDLTSDIRGMFALDFETLSADQIISTKKIDPLCVDYESKGKIYWHWRREKLLCFWWISNDKLKFLCEVQPATNEQVKEMKAEIRESYREYWDK